MANIVELPDIPVMYVVSPNGPMGSESAFKKLEDAIGWQLKGRRFYGTMDANGEYRSCLAIDDEDEPKRLGFPVWTIPGGEYKREKIEDWNKHLSEIGPSFKKLAEGENVDNSRPSIEFYRSMKELFIHVPIK